MPRIIYLLILYSLSSCLSEKKATGWLNKHKQQAAAYCANTFPPDTLTRTVIENADSSGYFDAYLNMAGLADSLFNRLDSIEHLPAAERPRLNIDSIRKVVDKEIRKRLAPCIDTTISITYTIRDRAKEIELQVKIDEKDKVISARDKRITELEAKVKSKNKWLWMFWGLVLLVGGYAIIKIRGRLLIIALVALFSCNGSKKTAQRDSATIQRLFIIPGKGHPPATGIGPMISDATEPHRTTLEYRPCPYWVIADTPKCEHKFVAVEEPVIKIEPLYGGVTLPVYHWPSGIQDGKDIICVKCFHVQKQKIDYGQPEQPGSLFWPNSSPLNIIWDTSRLTTIGSAGGLTLKVDSTIQWSKVEPVK
jgi:hypothetical protein